MQQLQTATEPPASQPDGCADEVLAAIPVLMRLIREQMRSHRRAELSVPQFRTLIFIRHTPGATLSVLAEHLGLSLPAVSRLVAGLVNRGLVLRQQRTDNRRCVRLSLTYRGRAAFQSAFDQTRMAFAQRLTALSDRQRREVSRTMRLLNSVFNSPGSSDDLPQSPKPAAPGVQNP